MRGPQPPAEQPGGSPPAPRDVEAIRNARAIARLQLAENSIARGLHEGSDRGPGRILLQQRLLRGGGGPQEGVHLLGPGLGIIPGEHPAEHGHGGVDTEVLQYGIKGKKAAEAFRLEPRRVMPVGQNRIEFSGAGETIEEGGRRVARLRKRRARSRPSLLGIRSGTAARTCLRHRRPHRSRAFTEIRQRPARSLEAGGTSISPIAEEYGK
jgi:hypothetical protein